MARRGGSFQYEKRQKELKKQKRKKEKLERRKARLAGNDPDAEATEGEAEDKAPTTSEI